METADGPKVIEHVSQSLPFIPFSVSWVPSSARILVAGMESSASGIVQIRELEAGQVLLRSQARIPNGARTVSFGASCVENRSAAIGFMDGEVSIFSVEDLDKPLWKVRGHESVVNCIDGCGGLEVGYGAPELVTGGRDGCVKVWDPRTNKAVVSFEPETDMSIDCWAVAFGNSFNDQERLVASGYENGQLKLFDLRTNKAFWEWNCASGICALEFDQKDIEMNKLVVATLSSKFDVFEMRKNAANPPRFKEAHKSPTVWDVQHLPQDREIFMTLMGNGELSLYRHVKHSIDSADKVQNKELAHEPPTMLTSKQLSSHALIACDWSLDKAGLAVLSGLDRKLRVLIIQHLKHQ